MVEVNLPLCSFCSASRLLRYQSLSPRTTNSDVLHIAKPPAHNYLAPALQKTRIKIVEIRKPAPQDLFTDPKTSF